MTNVAWVNRRYQLATKVLESRVEVMLIGDESGANFDLSLRGILSYSRDDPDVWEDLIHSAKALRSRLLTNPESWDSNSRVHEAIEAVLEQVRLLGKVAGSISAVDQMFQSCEQLLTKDLVVGPILVESIHDVGACNCIVVTNTSAVNDLARWLQPLGVVVLSSSELIHQDHEVEQIYVVGPPRFFPSALVTAPVSSQIAFLLPHWFQDRNIPGSSISQYAEGAFVVQLKLSSVNPVATSTVPIDESVTEDDLLPSPQWTVKAEPDRQPIGEEVLARRVLLSGGFYVYLDDGERIRTLDPVQPPQERVASIPVDSVVPGTYLILRRRESEQGILYHAALNSFGTQAAEMMESQERWKEALGERINQLGADKAAEELREMGVKAFGRVAEWTRSTLDRPQRTIDFQLLLRWLGIKEQPTFDLATRLRRKRLLLGQEMRRELETILSTMDLTPLLRNGHLELLAADPQFRDMIAARVIAISPYQEIISRQRARVLLEDSEGGGQWLE